MLCVKNVTVPALVPVYPTTQVIHTLSVDPNASLTQTALNRRLVQTTSVTTHALVYAAQMLNVMLQIMPHTATASVDIPEILPSHAMKYREVRIGLLSPLHIHCQSKITFIPF